MLKTSNNNTGCYINEISKGNDRTNTEIIIIDKVSIMMGGNQYVRSKFISFILLAGYLEVWHKRMGNSDRILAL